MLFVSVILENSNCFETDGDTYKCFQKTFDAAIKKIWAIL